MALDVGMVPLRGTSVFMPPFTGGISSFRLYTSGSPAEFCRLACHVEVRGSNLLRGANSIQAAVRVLAIGISA